MSAASSAFALAACHISTGAMSVQQHVQDAQPWAGQPACSDAVPGLDCSMTCTAMSTTMTIIAQRPGKSSATAWLSDDSQVQGLPRTLKTARQMTLVLDLVSEKGRRGRGAHQTLPARQLR